MHSFFIVRLSIKIIFFISAILFAIVPQFANSENKIFNNNSSDSIHISHKNKIDSAHKEQSLTFNIGLEAGYIRLHRNYHIISNPFLSGNAYTILINGDAAFIGLNENICYKKRFFFSAGAFIEYQRFHLKEIITAINGYNIWRENFLNGILPFTFSATIPLRHLNVNSELGYLQSFSFFSEFSQISGSPYGKIIFQSGNIPNVKYYSSMFLGARFGLKKKNIFVHIRYVIGLTKIMLLDHDPTFPAWPPPNDYYRKNGISLSIQYQLN